MAVLTCLLICCCLWVGRELCGRITSLSTVVSLTRVCTPSWPSSSTLSATTTPSYWTSSYLQRPATLRASCKSLPRPASKIGGVCNRPGTIRANSPRRNTLEKLHRIPKVKGKWPGANILKVIFWKLALYKGMGYSQWCVFKTLGYAASVHRSVEFGDAIAGYGNFCSDYIYVCVCATLNCVWVCVGERGV